MKIVKIIRDFLDELKKDHVSAYATQSAFFIMLSFIPFILLFLTLIQYTALTKSDLYTLMLNLMPDQLDSFVIGIINEVYSRGASTVSIAALTTIWSAGKGFKALIEGMNAIYKIQEKRNYVLLRLQGAIYTLVFLVSIVIMLLLVVFGTHMQRVLYTVFPLSKAIISGVLRFQELLSLGIFTLFFMILYKFLPDQKMKFLKQLPGAIFTAVSWYLFSFGFSIYVNHTRNLTNMYGSLTTVVIAMLWLYFCMYLLLIGAKVNEWWDLKKVKNLLDMKDRCV